MCVLGKDILEKLIDKYKVIYPFNHELLDGDGYILTVKEERTLHYLEHQNVISNEVVFTPPSYIAYLTAKSKFGRLGLSFLNSTKVHSGFVGRLILELVNLSNERTPITIKKGDPLIHIEFISREGKPSTYAGQYMFQYMDDSEVNAYIPIIKKNFAKAFDVKELESRAGKRIV